MRQRLLLAAPPLLLLLEPCGAQKCTYDYWWVDGSEEFSKFSWKRPDLCGQVDPDPCDGKEGNPHLPAAGERFDSDCANPDDCSEDWSCIDDYTDAMTWELKNPRSTEEEALIARAASEKISYEQSNLTEAEAERARLQENVIMDRIGASVTELKAAIEANKTAQIAEQDKMVEAELKRSEAEMDGIREEVTEWNRATGALLKVEQEKAAEGSAQRARLQEQLGSLRKMMHANYCPEPALPSWTQYASVHENVPEWISEAIGCDNAEVGNCINKNAAYTSLREAWLRCGEDERCGMIMNYTMDGKLYLRRRADMAGLRVLQESNTSIMPVARILRYECMPLCPVVCQRQSNLTTNGGVCEHCASGEWQQKTQRCLTPRRNERGDMGVLLEASGACPEEFVDCRVCTGGGEASTARREKY